MNPADPAAVKRLHELIEAFAKNEANLHSVNYHTNWILILASLLVVAAIVIAGINNRGKQAAILGVINGVIIGVHSGFGFQELSQFRRETASEARTLLINLDVRSGQMTDQQLDDARTAFNTLRTHADKVPKGEGMQAAIRMHDEMKSKSATLPTAPEPAQPNLPASQTDQK
jgi:hypothetical protein